MELSAREVAAAVGLAVVVWGPGAARPVAVVRLLGDPAEVPGGEPVVPGTLLVLPWTAPRRGAALPSLPGLLGPLLDAAAPWSAPGAPVGVAVVTPADRVVVPPPDVLALAGRAGATVLWGTGDAAEVAARLQAALPRRDPVGELLVGDLDLVVVVNRLAAALGCEVTVADSTGRELATGDGGAADGPVAATEPEPVPLLLGGRRMGVLWVGRPLGEAQRELVEAVVPVLVLALRLQLGEERADAPAGRMLSALLGEDLAAREAAVRRSRRLAAFPARSAVFLVLVPFGRAVAVAGLQRLAQAVEPAVRAVDERGVVVVHEGSIVVLVGAGVDLDRLQRAMYRRVNVPLSIGAGRPVDDVRSFAGAHRQALRAAVVGRALGSANRVTRFDDLGVNRLLFQLPEHERRSYARDVLGSVADDTPAAAEGRRVLRAFRAANGNVTEAARQLFLHHNTFRQRLARLRTEVGDVLEDPDRRLAVFVALDLHRLDTERDS
ncbi:helix-turn-helix domain-containing protein [Klenkia sp. LSe6-5]|uniref:Helix-turn-helix domain-containing protein n=1 Tax=Klenkia sesuvii TaxID=3103137 RepID=A0ABU8DRU8_9ACTN